MSIPVPNPGAVIRCVLQKDEESICKASNLSANVWHRIASITKNANFIQYGCIDNCLASNRLFPLQVKIKCKKKKNDESEAFSSQCHFLPKCTRLLTKSLAAVESDTNLKFYWCFQSNTSTPRSSPIRNNWRASTKHCSDSFKVGSIGIVPNSPNWTWRSDSERKMFSFIRN